MKQPVEVMCPHAKSVLASRSFYPYEMADQYGALEQRLAYDFSASIKGILRVNGKPNSTNTALTLNKR